MDLVIEFFRRNPVLLLVAAVWIAGIVGNIARAAKKARERAAERMRPTPVPGPVAARSEPAREVALPRRTEEDVAREMRRILGVETDEDAEEPSPATPPPLPARRQPQDAVAPERAPTPVLPTTSARKLPIHIDPHVGEGIQQRAKAPVGRLAAPGSGPELGSLGGRAHRDTRRAGAARRYALDDLKRVVVLNEILGPPLALRSGERTF